MHPWAAKDIPSQRGRLAVITGATGGLGYQTALALAGAGAKVVLTGRNAAKGKAALENIRAVYADAAVRYEHLDLNSQASVKDFSGRFAREHGSLDILINNGGVMAPPARHTTADGFELQFGTNYLSHFALTAQLFPLLRRGKQPRVVNLSSVFHRFGARIHFGDLQRQRSYRALPAYGQSKLAMLMFAFEMHRRSDANGWGLMCSAAHPGYALTGLQSTGPRMGRNGKAGIVERMGSLLEPLIAHSAAEGALPVLYAATSPEAKGGGYYGPQGFMELKGAVGEAIIGNKAKDLRAAAKLWSVSEKLTDARWGAAAS